MGELRYRVIHGYRRAYRMAGGGPALLLVHGISDHSGTWVHLLPELAKRYTVVAPDLLGHGGSDKPRADYAAGAYACGMRDLLTVLDIDRVTVVGHSLGGGVAMQFAYQFPERCERLVLVDSGGLGREVNVLLRAATLPGAELVLPLLAHARLIDGGRRVGGLLSRIGLHLTTDLDEIARGHASLTDPETRSAFVHTLRTLIEPGGQRIDASDRLYLAHHIPLLLVWGERDRIIPVSHGRAAHAHVPNSRLEVFPAAGHFPQLEDPQRFVDVLKDFIDTSDPSRMDHDAWIQLIRDRTSASVRDAEG